MSSEIEALAKAALIYHEELEDLCRRLGNLANMAHRAGDGPGTVDKLTAGSMIVRQLLEKVDAITCCANGLENHDQQFWTRAALAHI